MMAGARRILLLALHEKISLALLDEECVCDDEMPIVGGMP
jgi:hypothetical protein